MDTKTELKPPKRILVFETHTALVSRFSPDAHVRFFEPSAFPWIARLEANWRTIRRDLDVALAKPEKKIPSFGDVSSRQKGLASERWKTLVFYFWGRRVRENCERFPETDALLRQIPDMTTAMFSILEGGGTIPLHRGPFKGILRYHLGLQVPVTGEDCAICVGGETRTWEEGKSLVFDDTFPHEVWNRDPRPRVVLFVDVVRPMPRVLEILSRAMLGLAKHAPDIREVEQKAGTYAR